MESTKKVVPVKAGTPSSNQIQGEVRAPENTENEEPIIDMTSPEENERLAELNMKYGCAHVYRIHGHLFGWGDYNHSPAENINQNLKILAKVLQNNPSLSYAGKDYDSDTYQGKEKIKLALIKNQVEVIYGEKLFELNLDGGINSEAIV